MRDAPEQHTFADVRDEKGMYKRWVTLNADTLTIEGHDLGDGVREIYGFDEYEFERTLDAAGVAQLRQHMGVSDDDSLIAAIAKRFESSVDLERFIEAHEIASEFWNRIGD